MTTVGDVVEVLEAAYPPALAESWDAVGLVCGDPAEPVTRVLVCVDPVESTVDEALASRRAAGRRAPPAAAARRARRAGRARRRAASCTGWSAAGAALFCAHTNADAADPGVSDALADAIGLTVVGPLNPNDDGRTGIGRIGELPAAEPFGAFVERVAAALPATAAGVRGAGDPDRPIRTVAVSGGAGDSYLGRRERRRRGRLRHRRPAPPPRERAPGGGGAARARRRRALGERVAVVRAGGGDPA